MSGSQRTIGQSVAEGVGCIPGFVNSYTLEDGEQVYLVDTGFSSKAKAIVRAFRTADVPLDRVKKILLTHRHPDHMGGAAYLHSGTGAVVECQTEDAPYVDGRTKPPMSLLMRLFVRLHPVPVGVELKGGEIVGPLSVIFVPGHTAGEVAFYDSARKILFSGDSVVEHDGHLALPAPRYATNVRQAVDSLNRLKALEIELLLPGHGQPVRKDVAGLLEELIRRAPATYLGRS